MKILVTGATGFFGRVLARQVLEKTGHTLVLLVREGRDCGFSGEERVEPATGDVTDAGSIRRAAEGCGAVIHAAAKVAAWARDRSEFDRVNVEGTLNVLRASGEAGAEKILYTSSFMALGPSGGSPLNEQSSYRRDSFFNDYERTKYLAHEQALRLAEEGLPLVILYPTVMYGPGPRTAGNLVVNLILDYLAGRLPARLGDGSPRWDYVYAEDAAAGHVLALERAGAGKRYILGGENVSTKEFLDLLENLSGVPAPGLAVPFGLGRMWGAVEELAAFVSGRVPRMTRAVADIFSRDWTYDSSLARKELGYQARSLRQGLSLTLEWLRSEKLA